MHYLLLHIHLDVTVYPEIKSVHLLKNASRSPMCQCFCCWSPKLSAACMLVY